MRIILCLIFFVAGCANRRVSMANYLIEAQTEFPWKLEFCTDVDIFRMHEASGAAAMWITVEYPKLYGNRKLVLFIEDFHMHNTYYDGYIRGVRERNIGWYSNEFWRIGYYGWPGRLSDKLIEMQKGSKDGRTPLEISVDFRVKDFATFEACEKFLQFHDVRSYVDFALNDNGVWVCIDYNNNNENLRRLSIDVHPLSIAGGPLPSKLLQKYKRGSVTIKKL